MVSEQIARCATVPLVTVTALTKTYAQRRLPWQKQQAVTAVDRVELEIYPGETQGIVGTSGSGKSTLALCVAGLEKPTSGSVLFNGCDVSTLRDEELRGFRRSVQLVLQDSATALNPRFKAIDIVCEPMLICDLGKPEEQRAQALELMLQLDLPASLAERRPHQLSGGQRQRLAIARALTLKPSLLILDEVLTGLDVPVQNQFLDLLKSLSRMYSFTSLFISHDLRLVRSITKRVAVMHAGRIVEQGKTCELFANPQHPHTLALLSAMPGQKMFACVAAEGD